MRQASPRRTSARAHQRKVFFEALEPRRVLALTTPDPFFGLSWPSDAGSITTDFYADPNSHDSALSIAVQSDGKIIAVGEGGTLARFTAAGVLDSTFGRSGKATFFGAANRVAIQSNGKIVLGGYVDNGVDRDFALARYNSDGSLDPAFGQGGKVVYGFAGSHDVIQDMAIDSSGRIVVTGHFHDIATDYPDFIVARFTTGGTLDTEFSGDGIQRIDIDPDLLFKSQGRTLAIQSDGRIVVAGWVDGDSSAATDYAFVFARLHSTGDLDTSFSSDGVVAYSFGTIDDAPMEMALQADGKIVVTGYTKAASGYDPALVRLKTDGTLDSTFDGDGLVTSGFGSGDDSGNAVAIQSDGKIVVGGRIHDGSNDKFAVWRYNSDGSLDTSFDGTGRRTIPLGTTQDEIRALSVRSDGSILVGGYAQSSDGSGRNFALAKLSSAGALVTTFSGDGIHVEGLGTSHEWADAIALYPNGHIVAAGTVQSGVSLDFAFSSYFSTGFVFGSGVKRFDIDGANDVARDVMVDSSGRVLVVGAAFNGSQFRSVIMRLFIDGSLDTSFGTGGIVRTAVGTIDDCATGVVQQSDGKLVVGGYTRKTAGGDFDFFVARYNNDGSLDTTFDGDGIQTIDFTTSGDGATSLALAPDGKIVVAGDVSDDANEDFGIARLNSNGSIDTSFSGDGKVITPIGPGRNTPTSVVVLPDGRIVAGGFMWSGSAWKFALTKYLVNGELDTRFGNAGIVMTAFGSLDDAATELALLPDGRLVASGYSHNGKNFDIAVARYQSNGELDESFDFDGKKTLVVGANNDRAYGMAIQSDGRIVVAGASAQGGNGEDFAIAKFYETEPLQLLKDINTSGAGAFPDEVTNVNGTLYYMAHVNNQSGLWRTDGTAEGTRRVFATNDERGLPSDLTNVNGTLYFFADNGTYSTLWTTDGTEEGTKVVRSDIRAGNDNSRGLPYPINLNGILYFSAIDGVNGYELWRSNGTSAGTYMVKDIRPGNNFAYVEHLTTLNGKLYFSAWDGSKSNLWMSDGTTSGTVPIGPSDGVFIDNIQNVNGTLYFSGRTAFGGAEVWKSSGTAAGTIQVKTLGGPAIRNFTSAGGVVYFTAQDANGRELWRTDGTTAGTIPVADLNPNAASSDPSYLTEFQGSLFFRANDGTHGVELWKTDGTVAGTTRITDLAPSSSYPTIGKLNVVATPAGPRIVFAANDGPTGSELWSSDGTAAGTNLLIDLASGGTGSNPKPAVSFGNRLVFTANDIVHGIELWLTDGTAAGTVMVNDLLPATNGSQPTDMITVGDKVFFTADNGLTGRELWVTDGTSSGTMLLNDIRPGSDSSVLPIISGGAMVNVNGTLYFTADDGVNGVEIWKSDGTSTGTQKVTELRSGTDSASISNLVNFNGTLFFSARDDNEFRLWKSDGTTGGTVGIKSYGLAGAAASLIVVGNSLFFTAIQTGNGRELWKSDGTPEGTAQLKDLNGTTTSSGPTNLINVNGTLIFTAVESASSGRELWRSDGTEAGTVQIVDLRPDAGSDPQYLTPGFGSLFFFTADDGSNGRELWISNGTGVNRLTDTINPLSASSNPRNITNVNGFIYFTADSPWYGREIWRFDGQTKLLKNIATSDFGVPSDLYNANGTLFFTADDGVAGRELWRSDGTEKGTRLVDDLMPGKGSGATQGGTRMATLGNQLFLMADSPHAGQELHVLSLEPGFDLQVTRAIHNGSKIVVEYNVNSYGGPARPFEIRFARGTNQFFLPGAELGSVWVDRPEDLAQGAHRLVFDAPWSTTGGTIVILDPRDRIIEWDSHSTMEDNSNAASSDTLLPVVTLTAPAITSDTTPALNATVRDANIQAGIRVYVDVDLNNDGDFSDEGETRYTSATVSLISGSNPATYQASWSLSPALPEGTYRVRAWATDQAENTGFSATTQMIVDTTSPDVALSLASFTSDTTPIVSIQVEDLHTPDGTLVTLDVDLNDDGDFDDDGEAGYAAASLLSGMAAIELPELAEGAYRVRARVTDQAGNNASTAGLRFVVDASPPVITIDAPSLTGDTSPSVTVTVADATFPEGSSVQLDVDLNDDGDFEDAGERDYTTAVTTSGQAEFEISPPLALGFYSLRARATDAAGNEGLSATSAIIIENTVPTGLILTADALPEDTDTSASRVLAGALTAQDPDEGATQTYSLVEGSGDTDNALFEIENGQLFIKQGVAIDYEDRATYEVRVRVTDNHGDFEEQAFQVQVSDRNDAPRLTVGEPVQFDMILEDDFASPGMLVEGLLGGVADQDADALPGIAIIGSTGGSTGAWQFTTNGGTSWQPLGARTNTSALLLSANGQTRLRYVPQGNFHGDVQLTFRAWDQTQSDAGEVVAITSTGGTSAFSSESRVGQLTVEEVPDLPEIVNFGSSVTYTENASAIAIAGSATVTDADSVNFAGGSLTVQFTSGGLAADVLSLRSTSTLTVNALGEVIYQTNKVGDMSGGRNGLPLVVAFNERVTPGVAGVLLRNVVYSNTSDSPAASRTITVRITDADGGDSIPFSKTINATPLKDTPIVNNFGGDLTFIEDGPFLRVAATNATVTDGDAEDFGGGTLTVKFSAGVQPEDFLAIRSVGGITTNTDKEVFHNSLKIGDYSGGTGGTALVVTFNADAKAAAATAVLKSVFYRALSQRPHENNRRISVQVNDGHGLVSTAVSKLLSVQGINDAPELTGFGSSPVGYVRNSAVVVALAPNAEVKDVDNYSFNGGSLQIQVTQGQDNGNVLSIAGPTYKIMDGFVYRGTIKIGTVDVHNANELKFTFNESAVISRVQALIRAIRFRTVNSLSDADRIIAFTFKDIPDSPGVTQTVSVDVQ